MPDLLTHYAISYLIASRIVKPKYALVIAIAGILPDIDALLRVHRWITHSLVLVIIVSLVLFLFSKLTTINKHTYHVILLFILLYALHIVLDIFTGPTPILWPLTMSSYAVTMSICGTVGEAMIGVKPEVTIISTSNNFTQQQVLQGSIATDMGVIIAIGVTVTIFLEQLENLKLWFKRH